jgi:hypothetical protein
MATDILDLDPRRSRNCEIRREGDLILIFPNTCIVGSRVLYTKGPFLSRQDPRRPIATSFSPPQRNLRGPYRSRVRIITVVRAGCAGQERRRVGS